MSTEPKFTPGPWEIIDATQSVYVPRQDGSRVRIVYVDHCFALFGDLVEPEWSAASDQMREANAHLIAAAPDLFQVLGDLRGHIENAHDEFYSLDGGDLRMWIALIDAAISKANPTAVGHSNLSTGDAS
ncbi:MAG: hypothetical protein EOS10_00215 [Mesorhizobium sp.]|uniref:hypothetical protein n=1 Tax=Mesorhizobium sp. TaxID=1871066 RepID=UPI000FE5C7E4|nr:hypothetical protein [Mesorhizobium sp.]RWO34762.1 MAG: hypothetical protein EOS10_00215 [Mesorhizobium sp.]